MTTSLSDVRASKIEIEVAKVFGLNEGMINEIIRMNDRCGASFLEIADFLDYKDAGGTWQYLRWIENRRRNLGGR